MNRIHYLVIMTILVNLFVFSLVMNGQTIDELNTRVKQLEAENRALQSKINKLQKGKSQSLAEAEETIQLLLEEKKILQEEIDSLVASDNDSRKREEMKKRHQITVKDPVFQEYLLRFCDMDNDGVFTQWDAEHTYVIDIARDKSFLNLIGNSNQITSIEGIEHFIYLKRLVCSGNSISQIDLSKNGELETFVANGCNLKLLDVSKNTRLTHLECNNNLLYTIELKNNPNIHSLDVSKNKMATIDISRCTKIVTFNCSGNALTDLNVSNNIELQTIDCSNNKIGTLSFAKNTSLDNINCSNNKLTDVDVKNGIDIKYFDCSKNKDLEFVYFSKGCRVLSDKRDQKTYFK